MFCALFNDGSRRMSVCVLVTVLAIGGAARAEDLLDVYRSALSNDMKFSSAKAQVEATRQKLGQARAGLLPQVSLHAMTSWTNEHYAPPAIDSSFNANGYAVVLTQPLFRMQNLIQYDQSKLTIANAEMRLESARQDLILRVTKTYFDVLLAREALQTAQAQQQTLARQKKMVDGHYKAGTATLPDVHDVQARFDLANAQVIAAASELQLRLEALRQLAGVLPAGLAALRADARIDLPQPAAIDDWSLAATQDNLDVQAAGIAVRMAGKEMDKQRAGHLPTLDLVVGQGRLSQGGGVIFDFPIPSNRINQTTVGLQLMIPIFAGGGINARAKEAAALKSKQEDEYEDLRRNASLRARQAYLSILSGINRIKALQQALRSSETTLKSNQLAYEVGTRVTSDVLNAEQQVTSTRQQLSQARFDTLLAELQLKAAVGRLDVGELERINALLDKRPQIR
ncbi:TolC family outer membrane protein [Burkholderia sp. Ac-20353]|uniref:TolC family outer membrane protein n=1 Tax=Burkholderia sp. Ac-20353 TaxID=2703894 RepID=UPI00197C36E4|nr:TolC family outer membrane protein [Burkholderia sp. Ac-20353]MBN3790358.1 TolC family outer membrane protein [Burkholderia sp. Ac-20353]